MKKKNYVAPQIEVTEIELEGILCASLFEESDDSMGISLSIFKDDDLAW